MRADLSADGDEVHKVATSLARTTISRKNVIGRAIWRVMWLLTCRFSPIPCHAWRRAVLRTFGAKMGSRSIVYPTAVVWAPWNLTMESDSCIAESVECYNVASVCLGRGVIVSQGAYLCSASHDFRVREFPLVSGGIVIESGAWICARAFIGPGVKIGMEAVIGACSVVTRDVEANSVVVGNPCRIVGRRHLDGGTAPK